MSTDIHPKVLGASVGAAMVSLLTVLLGAYGHPVPAGAEIPLQTIGAFIGGYIPAGSNT